MAFFRRRGSTINREDFGNFQADFFTRHAQGTVRNLEADTFARDAQFELERLQAQQQYEPQSEDPGIYNIPGVKGIWEGTGTALGGVLDILGRPAATVAGGVLAVQEGRPIWDGWKEGFLREKENLNFATVLENAGMDNEAGRNVLGFALDMVLDPLNVFMIPKVSALTGRVAQRAIIPVADMPVGRATLGDLVSDFPLVHLPRLGLAKLFGRRPGAGAGRTEYEMRRAWRKEGISKENRRTLEGMLDDARTYKVQTAKGTELAGSELTYDLHKQRMDELVADGMDPEEAFAQANEMIHTFYSTASDAIAGKTVTGEDFLGGELDPDYNIHQVIGRMMMTLSEMLDNDMMPTDPSDFLKKVGELGGYGPHEIPLHVRRGRAGELDPSYVPRTPLGTERGPRTRRGVFLAGEQARYERFAVGQKKTAEQPGVQPRKKTLTNRKEKVPDWVDVEAPEAYRINTESHKALKAAQARRKAAQKRVTDHSDPKFKRDHNESLKTTVLYRGKRYDPEALREQALDIENGIDARVELYRRAERRVLASDASDLLKLEIAEARALNKVMFNKARDRAIRKGRRGDDVNRDAVDYVFENHKTPIVKAKKDPVTGEVLRKARFRRVQSPRKTGGRITQDEQAILDLNERVMAAVLKRTKDADEVIYKKERDVIRVIEDEIDELIDGYELESIVEAGGRPGMTMWGKLRAEGWSPERIKAWHQKRWESYQELDAAYTARHGRQKNVFEKWEEFTETMEEWGANALEIQGLGTIARVMQQKWGPIEKIGENIRWGDLASKEAVALGLIPTESVYIARMFPSKELISGVQRDYPQLVPTLSERVMQRKQTALEAIAGGVELDWRVILQSDIAARRTAFLGAKIVDSKVLLAAGGRQVISKEQATKLQRVISQEYDISPDRVNQALMSYQAGEVTAAEAAAAVTKEAYAGLGGQVDDLTRSLNQVDAGATKVVAPDSPGTPPSRSVDPLDEGADVLSVDEINDEIKKIIDSLPEDEGVTLRRRSTAGESLEELSRSAERLQHSMTAFLRSQPSREEGVFVRGNPMRNLMDPEDIDDVTKKAGLPSPEEVFDEAGNTWVLPKTMAETYQKFNNPYEMGGFLKSVDAFNNLWKPTVTTFPLFTSFFVRNGIGLVNLLILSGMNPWALAKHSLKAARVIKSGVLQNDQLVVQYTMKGRQRVAERLGVDISEVSALDTTVNKLVHEARLYSGLDVGARGQPVVGDPHLGAAGGWRSWYEARTQRLRGEPTSLVPVDPAQRRIGPTSRVEEFEGLDQISGPAGGAFKGILNQEELRRLTPMEQTKAAIARYDETIKERLGYNLFAWGSTANQTMDNTARLTHIMWRVSEGDTVADASRSAAKWIGDYTDLGEGTKAISAVIPFFRWTRFNLPIQIEGLLRRPFLGSKLAAVTGDEAEREQVLSEGATLPDWVLDRHHVVLGRTPEGRLQILRGLGLPIEDLNKIFARTGRDTWMNILQEASPALRVPIEWATHKSFFTGESIDDKDDLYGFYKRGYAWATLPGVSQTLNQWLQVSREVNPDTGKVTYRSDNPMAMYTLGSFAGRFAYTFDKIHQSIESREEVGLANVVGLLSGARISEVFPDRPEATTFNEALNESPYLRSLYSRYQNIPLYPQFENVDMSHKAVRAMTDINAYRRLLAIGMGADATWDLAARQYGELSRDNREGEILARQIKKNRWTQKGKAERKRFRDAHPAFYAAMTDSLTDHERYIALDGDASPS